MKILLSYASEYDKGEGVHFVRVLRRMGCDVVALNVAANGKGVEVPGWIVQGFPDSVHLEDILSEVGGADLFLYIEPLGLIPRGLESSPIPTACIISDCHRSLNPRQTLGKLFDQIFLYQRNYVGRFLGRDPAAVHWLPYACDTEVVRNLGLPREIDVAFIGNLFGRRSERRRIIEAIAKKYRVNEQRYYTQQEIPEVYSRAKIVLNLPVGDDLNFRFFEALSCGAMLLTKPDANGQEELFIEDIHYVAFSSEQELFDKVEYYLQNEEELKSIALRGHEEVVRHHGLAHRLETLLDRVRSGPELAAPVRTMRKDAVLKLYASVYERAGKVEAILKLAAEQRPNSAVRLWMLAFGLKSFIRRAVFGW